MAKKHISYRLDKIIDIFNVVVYKICELTDTDDFAHFVRKLEKDFVIGQFKRFFKKEIKTPSVLIIEINSCHGETLASVFKYFKNLGFNVDILVNWKQYLTKSLALAKLEDNDKIFAVTNHILKKCIASSKIKKYDYVFFNSYQTYINQDCPDIFELYQNIKYPKFGLCGYVHHLDLYKKTDKNRMFHPFSLTKMENEISKEDNFINPNYFVDNIKIKNKNKKTNFTMIGNIQQKRRNYDLLFDTVEKLHYEGKNNFKITIIGQGNIAQLPKHLRKYFDIKGWLNYPEMYENIKKTDFLLPLLDSQNSDHKRYLKDGTSGNFQLIYGFYKPCLIEESFALIHNFNEKNSIIYLNKDNFKSAMIKAINLKNQEYISMQKNLKELQKELFQKSQDNLKNYIEEQNEYSRI